MTSFVVGAGLLLGVLLVTAGAMKLVRPRGFAHAVARLLPGPHDGSGNLAIVAAPAVGLLELAAGAGLLTTSELPTLWARTVALAGAALYVGFVPVVVLAIRKGEACACWSSFSDGVAGGSELGRSLALALIAVAAAVVELVRAAPREFPALAVLWAFGLGALPIAAAFFARGVAAPRVDEAAYAGRRGERVARVVAFAFGRITSSKAAFALQWKVRLPSAERDRWAAAVNGSPAVVAVSAWLAERGKGFDPLELSAHRVTVRTATGRMHHLLLRTSGADGVGLTIALRLDGAQASPPTVFGMVDGIRVDVTKTGELTAREAEPTLAIAKGRPRNRDWVSR